MKEKQYNIKFYNQDGTSLKVLNTRLLDSEIRFKSVINSGQGSLVLELRTDSEYGLNGFDDFGEYEDALQPFKFVKVFQIDENNKTGRLIYTGFVSKVEPYIDGQGEGVSVTCLGLTSLLALSLFKDGASFDPSYTSTDPKDIIEDIIDHFNSLYSGSWISYSGGHVDTVGTAVTLDFEKDKWNEALGECRRVSGGGYFWRVDPDGQVYFTKKSVSADHTFTLGKNVDTIKVEKNSESIINKNTVKWSSGTVTSSDATSIAAYGTRERYNTSENIKDSSTAQQEADQLVEDNKDLKVKVIVEISSDYDFETIRVGETCKILGLKKDQTLLGNNMQIVGLTYTPDKATLELEEYQDFAEAVKAI